MHLLAKHSAPAAANQAASVEQVAMELCLWNPNSTEQTCYKQSSWICRWVTAAQRCWRRWFADQLASHTQQLWILHRHPFRRWRMRWLRRLECSLNCEKQHQHVFWWRTSPAKQRWWSPHHLIQVLAPHQPRTASLPPDGTYICIYMFTHVAGMHKTYCKKCKAWSTQSPHRRPHPQTHLLLHSLLASQATQAILHHLLLERPPARITTHLSQRTLKQAWLAQEAQEGQQHLWLPCLFHCNSIHSCCQCLLELRIIEVIHGWWWMHVLYLQNVDC